VFAYIVRRLVLMLVTLFGISVIIFVLLRVVPGNIVDILFDAAGFVDPADKANLERELGLDQSIVVQYLHWIGGLLRGDLGFSYVSEKPALQEILPRIPITARLAGLALLFSASIGISLGVISAVKQGTRLDYALRVVSLSGLSLPSFWLGLLILMASVSLFGSMPIFNPNPATWTEAFAIYCVPAMAVGFRSAALTMRITRSSMLEILRQDYIRTARAKGASERSVNYHHALKNAILPVITVIGVDAAFLIGGLIVTETVFNLKDPKYPVEVTLHYEAYYNEDVIKTWTEIKHNEKAPLLLTNYASSMLHFDADKYWLTQFHGDWATEMMMQESQLTSGSKVIESKQGSRPDVYQAPLFMLALNKQADETTGEVLAGTLARVSGLLTIYRRTSHTSRVPVPIVFPFSS